MTKWFILSIYILLLYSCQYNKDQSHESIIQKWQGKEIKFPTQKPIFVNQKGDTIPLLDQETSYKVLLYINSLDEIIGKCQLSKWEEFIYTADSISREDISFYFIVAPNNLELIKQNLKCENFTYPVYYDLNDDFNKANNFPKEIDYHTFLLNKDNKVIAIGDPINYHSVREQYLNKLRYNAVIIDRKPRTAIKIEPEVIEVGQIPINSKFEQDIKIKNIGNAPFVLFYMTFSQNCINVKYNWEHIPTGDSCSMKVLYKANSIGDFTHSIMIFGNTPKKPIILDIKGSVTKYPTIRQTLQRKSLTLQELYKRRERMKEFEVR